MFAVVPVGFAWMPFSSRAIKILSLLLTFASSTQGNFCHVSNAAVSSSSLPSHHLPVTLTAARSANIVAKDMALESREPPQAGQSMQHGPRTPASYRKVDMEEIAYYSSRAGEDVGIKPITWSPISRKSARARKARAVICFDLDQTLTQRSTHCFARTANNEGKDPNFLAAFGKRPALYDMLEPGLGSPCELHAELAAASMLNLFLSTGCAM